MGTGNQVLGDQDKELNRNPELNPENMGAGNLQAEIDLMGWRDLILTGRIPPVYFWRAFTARVQVVVLL